MKKLLIIALAALSTMMVACKDEKAKTQDQANTEDAAQKRELDSLRQVSQEYEEMVNLIEQVNNGFSQIKEAEGRMEITDGSREVSQQQLINENMEFIQNTMAQNRALIEQLEKKLAKSTSNAQAFSKQLETLKKQMAEYKTEIDELKIQIAERDEIISLQGDEIASLSYEVNELTDENALKTAEVAAQDKELNTAWFVFGTKKELKENRILDSGDVLKNGDFNKNYFNKVDIREFDELRTFSKSAKMLTTHPSASYQLVKDEQGEYVLHINDAEAFWSVSKYLVIQVK